MKGMKTKYESHDEVADEAEYYRYRPLWGPWDTPQYYWPAGYGYPYIPWRRWRRYRPRYWYY